MRNRRGCLPCRPKRWLAAAGAAPLLLLVLVSPAAHGQTPHPPESMPDAELTSIVFVDADTGWAVGDRGVVWHTIDGGRHWQRQDTPVRCRLASVCFIDPTHGWAVGGSQRSYTHESEGVVLRTDDAGKTWQRVASLLLPSLKYVKFFDAHRGVAVGHHSPLFPAGVFTTVDGGQTWSTLPTSYQQQWRTADFSDFRTGVGISAAGEAVAVTAGNFTTLPRDSADLRQPRAARLSSPGVAWLCGDGSLLLQSRDGGATWAAPAGSLPAEAARQLDFSALATFGSHCWVAGNPGSLVFHSPDQGVSWHAYRTDHFAPLNGLFFLDENRGWAVGALGTILATRDGGKTWLVQRQGGQRAALLTLVSEAERVPHEMIVQQGGNEGYLTAVEILTHAEPLGADRALDHADRVRACGTALLATHVSSSWQFPLGPLDRTATLEQLLAKWDRGSNNATDTNRALARLEEHLVRRIRVWRPDVIVTEDADPSGRDPLAHLTNQLVLTAVQKAADPAAYRDHLAHAGLVPWKVKKVFATLAADKQGDVKLVCSQLAPRLGTSLLEVADEARAQLHDTYQVAPPQRGFNLLIDHLPQGQGRRDFFSGLALQPQGEARRSISNPPNPDLASLTKQIQKRQMLQGLLQRSDRDPLRGTAWLAQVTEMTRGLLPASSGRITYHLAQRYQASGEPELATEVMTTLVEQLPEHSLSDAALMWLIHNYTSEEAALRSLSVAAQVGPAPVIEPSESAAEIRPVSATEPLLGPVAGAGRIAVQPVASEQRAQRALAFGQLLEQRRPSLSVEPSIRFALATAVRQQAGTAAAERQLQSLAANASGDAWSQCAKAELWLANPEEGRCPKKVLACASASAKPRLDGRLDDAVWQSAKPISLLAAPGLASGGESPAATVALLYDDEFLYCAISCQRAAGVTYPADDRVRPRDADLSRHDRVELLLDIDRDFATYHRLVVDHRGWTNESSCGDATWDPTWYVAAAGDDAHWTVEAALPLAELSRRRPEKKAYWAVGVQRVVPAQQFQSWSTPADLDILPAGFGLMQFE
jgi:photosystem II stability/assembly factor-like uncharacterized protein